MSVTGPIAAQLDAGSLAVFPPPHTYIAPRDYTTNMGYVWFHGWAGRSGRGELGLGVRHPVDDGAGQSIIPGSTPRPARSSASACSIVVSDRPPEATLEDVLRFTNRDRFPALPGYKTLTSHWHWGYTIQALDQGENWVPPFTQVLKDMGINVAITCDFHGDGHPRDLTDLRLEELDAYYRMCRRQSDSQFLLIPSRRGQCDPGRPLDHGISQAGLLVHEQSRRRVRFSGRTPSTAPSITSDRPDDILEMVRREHGIMYQTHPRTKRLLRLSRQGSRHRLFPGSQLHRSRLEGHARRSVDAAAGSSRLEPAERHEQLGPAQAPAGRNRHVRHRPHVRTLRAHERQLCADRRAAGLSTTTAGCWRP